MEIRKISFFAVIFYLLSFFLVITRDKSPIYIKFIDVGQGDAVYIKTLDGKTLLIDGGDNSEADRELNQEMFFPFCHLDYIVLTHPHSDHYEGLKKILKRCSVGVLMFNDVSSSQPSWVEFKQLIGNNYTKNIFKGDEIFFSKGNIKILWPPRELIDSGNKNLNDMSVVLFLDYGDFEGLFMGDLQDNYQDDLDLSGIKGLIDGKLDVLKVSHHGSHNGVYSPLLYELSPHQCIISVGSDNKFGHPNPKSIEELEKAGCKVIRTDLEGNVVIKSN